MKEKNKSSSEESLHMGFFKKLKISMVNFEQYHIIAAEGWKKAIIYLLELVLLFSLIISCVTSYKLSRMTNAICLYAKNNIPDFRIENNEFYIDAVEPIIIENKDNIKTKIVLTNDTDSNQYMDSYQNNQENLIIITKQYIHIRTSNGGYVRYSIQDICDRFEVSKITKSELIEVLSKNSVFYILLIFIGLFLIYFISTLLDILALSVVGILVSRIIGISLKYSAIFGIATSSITLSVIINLFYIVLNMFTGFTIKYFQVMYSLVSYIYLIVSIILMRSNLIKIKTKVDKTFKEDNAEGASEE